MSQIKIATEIQQNVALHIGTITLQLIEQQVILKDLARKTGHPEKEGIDDDRKTGT